MMLDWLKNYFEVKQQRREAIPSRGCCNCTRNLTTCGSMYYTSSGALCGPCNTLAKG